MGGRRDNGGIRKRRGERDKKDHFAADLEALCAMLN